MELSRKQKVQLFLGIAKPAMPAGFSIPKGQLLISPRCDRCGASVGFSALEQHAAWHATEQK